MSYGQWEALIVGIDRYPSQTTLSDLTSGVKDGEDLSQRLQGFGYETFRIQRLPETLNQKGEERLTGTGLVSSGELKHKISNLFNPPDPNPISETALFFFSGHGFHEIIDGQEDVFLATSDAYPDGNIYGVSIRWLGEQIQRSKVNNIIIWLDCCYSGELLKYIPDNKDYCFITATRSYEVGKEISHQQGLLTEALLQGLEPENDADGWVDSYKLGQWVEKEMKTTSQRPLIANSRRNILLTKRNFLTKFKDECPYRSLSYFREIPEDATVFYGRKQITEKLLERLKKDRCLAILGASGSGKSSLLRAGLLYQLKLGQAILGSHLWTYLTPFSPTENPLKQLTDTCRGIIYYAPTNIINQNPLIIIIDQFEECFTMCDEATRKDFLGELVKLLQDYENLYLIIGMRSDFRGRLREYPDFVEQINKPYINVEHLNSEEIEEAIIKPAELVGVQIESSLKQQLLNDVEDYPGSLPLLQYTLTQLWLETRKQDEKFLKLKTYQNLGGIEGTLEKRADAVFESLDNKEQAIAQRLFLELTQIGETYDTRRRISLQELVNQYHSLDDLDKVTEKLADKDNRLILREGKKQPTLPSQEGKEKGKSKFVLLMIQQISKYGLTCLLLQQPTPKNDDSDIIIDVVHEALIRNWGRLRQWQDKYRVAMVIQREIETAAKDWVNQGKPDDPGLLLQGAKLGKATDYLSKYSQLKMLNGMAQDYIEVSQQQDKMRRWRNRGVMGVIAVMGVVSVFFAIDSNKRATVATLREQAATVKNLFPLELLEPLVLAIATTGDNLNAWQVREMLPEVRSSLYAAIDQVRERNTLEGHQSYVNSVAISEDGETIVSGSYDNTVKLWDRQGKLLHTFEGHQDTVLSVAISEDGETIVSGSYDNTVKLWDRQGKLLHTFEGHQDTVRSVAISDDGETIVSGSYDNTVKLWDRQGKLLHTLEGHQDWVNSVAISEDGETIVSGSGDNTVKLWDRQGKLLHTFEGHQDYVMSVAISEDGETIVSGSGDNTVKLWDRQGKLLHTFEGHQDYVMSVAISEDGETIVSGSDDNTVKLWDRQGKLLHTFEGHQDYVRSVAISDDGETIVSGSGDNTVKLWDRQGKLLHTFEGHQDTVRSVAISDDGETIVSGSGDNTVKLWDRQGKLLHTFEGHQDYVLSVAISDDGETIVSGSSDKTVKLWDRQGKLLETFEGHQSSVSSVAISEDGETIVYGSYDNTVKLWDRGGKLLHTFEGHQSYVTSVAISDDGETIVSGSDDKTVKLWDRGGKLLHTFEGHQNSVLSVAISEDGETIVSGSDDKTVKLWDRGGKLLETFEGHQSSVRSVAISDDGETIVSGSLDKTVKLWDRQGKLLETFEGHQNRVWSVAISEDGETIVSGSDDNTVKVWRGGDWSYLLSVGCNRLQFHPVLLSIPSVDMEDDAKSEAETAEKAAETCLNYGGWSDEEKAAFLVRQSLAIAEETGKIEIAKRKLKEAKRLDDTIDLKSLQQEVKQLAASTLVKQAKQVISENTNDNINRDISDAKQKLNEVKKLDPNIDLEDKKEIAQALIERGVSLAEEDEIDQALTAYQQAEKFYPDIKIEAKSWNSLCWWGSLNRKAKEVLFACENAVKNTNEAGYIDSRGLARALTGDFDGAIKDFQVFVDSPDISDESKNKRKQWIETLKKGENPFTDEVLEELKNR